MPKKDNKRKQEGEIGKSSPANIDMRKARLSIEKDMAAIQKLVDEHEFESEAEVNEFLQNLNSSGELPRRTAQSPLEKAQELIYDAWEMQNKRDMVKLARQALEISPDCADAYVILAEGTVWSIEEAMKLYQAGIEAGERALGAKMFAENVGHFWGILEARPYMRARAGLAQCLWDLGKHEEAIEHYQDMLRLNPGDNQGIRYLLAASLLEMGDIEALEQLLGQYDEPTAAWVYTGALVTFLQQGNSPESQQRLIEALKYNPYVAPYLLGEKRLPKRLPDYMGFGDKNEAIIYAAEFGSGWLKAEGAISWLESTCHGRRTTPQGKPKPLDIPEVFLKAFESEDKTSQPARQNSEKIYTFKVSLKESPEVWRKIEMKGSQTLYHLHKAIFKAYERYDERIYAFFLSNKPWDTSSAYSLPHPESPVKNVKQARIDSLGLRVKKKFLYLFGFGDEWWHSIQLLGIKKGEPEGKYPRIVESQGKASPQYLDEEEE
jgi:Plasmid pRiA4b ORF-3-like protein./ST7 protein.